VQRAADLAPRTVVIRGLGKAFGDTIALDDVSVEVPAGSILALLGPSGGGKTTLLRCLAGLERPDCGEILIGDAPVWSAAVEVAPERRGVGMVFQDGALFPHASVARNVGFGLSRRERRSSLVDELLALVGLEGLGDRSTDSLSGGQQQRVALARALACAPSVILLDEPFSNLDALLRTQLRRDVRDLMRDLEMTAIFVTHDQGEAFELGDEVAVMIDGSVQQQATPAALYARPGTRDVAEFIGEANVMAGDAQGAFARTAIGSVPLCEALAGPVELLIRPEQIEISPGSGAVVHAIEFYGHDSTYDVRLSDGRPVLVRVLGAPEQRVGHEVSVRYAGPPLQTLGQRPPATLDGDPEALGAHVEQPVEQLRLPALDLA
jgi:iron(III) transport system ATP-binding protein